MTRYRLVPIGPTGEKIGGADVIAERGALFLRAPPGADVASIAEALRQVDYRGDVVVFGGDVEFVEIEAIDEEDPER